jgi:hypothetical protein
MPFVILSARSHPVASPARYRLADRARSISSALSHPSVHLVALNFVPHSASATLDLVSRSISCFCIGTRKTVFSLVLRSAVMRYPHRFHHTAVPLPRHHRAAQLPSSVCCCRAVTFAGAWCNLPRAARSPYPASGVQLYEMSLNL